MPFVDLPVHNDKRLYRLELESELQQTPKCFSVMREWGLFPRKQVQCIYCRWNQDVLCRRCSFLKINKISIFLKNFETSNTTSSISNRATLHIFVSSLTGNEFRIRCILNIETEGTVHIIENKYLKKLRVLSREHLVQCCISTYAISGICTSLFGCIAETRNN